MGTAAKTSICYRAIPCLAIPCLPHPAKSHLYQGLFLRAGVLVRQFLSLKNYTPGILNMLPSWTADLWDMISIGEVPHPGSSLPFAQQDCYSFVSLLVVLDLLCCTEWWCYIHRSLFHKCWLLLQTYQLSSVLSMSSISYTIGVTSATTAVHVAGSQWQQHWFKLRVRGEYFCLLFLLRTLKEPLHVKGVHSWQGKGL